MARKTVKAVYEELSERIESAFQSWNARIGDLQQLTKDYCEAVERANLDNEGKIRTLDVAVTQLEQFHRINVKRLSDRLYNVENAYSMTRFNELENKLDTLTELVSALQRKFYFNEY